MSRKTVSKILNEYICQDASCIMSVQVRSVCIVLENGQETDETAKNRSSQLKGWLLRYITFMIKRIPHHNFVIIISLTHKAFFYTQSAKRLPAHETVYAITVHKSQGSEFDRALLILPDRDVPLLTRELLYTGITRAKNFMEFWGWEEIFREAVSRRITQKSGLGDAPWR